MSHRFGFLLIVAGSLVPSLEVLGQDSNVFQPTDSIEQLLGHARFEVLNLPDTRFEGDRTQRATLQFSDGSMILAKWAKAPRGGGEFNNRPRYEIAAYEFQKLFLDEKDYVVPPTVGRCVALDFYRSLDPDVNATFKAGSFVLVVLQYWLYNVRPRDIYQKDRFKADSIYARHLADFNILTHLIRHNDSNLGNFLISTDPTNPRVFAVDNGLSFGNEESNRGAKWRNLRVKRLPRGTIDRLRQLQQEDLQELLGVLAQFELRDGQMVEVEPGENLDGNRGVRWKDGVLQLGLTAREIRGVQSRLKKLLERVDSGKIELF